MRALFFCLFLALPTSSLGCAPGGAPPAPPTPAPPTPAPPARAAEAELFQSHGAVVIDTPNGSLRFAVELALTDKERQRGLMFREHLDDEAGMLFVFEKSRVQSFWMKNTRIPLDMIFIAEGGTIAGIVESAEPLTTQPRKVDGKPSRYVLELAGGAARKLGIAAGQRVHFEGVPTDLVDPGVVSGLAGTVTPPAAPSPAVPPAAPPGPTP